MAEQKYFTKSKKGITTISTLGKAGGEGQVYLTDTNQAAKIFNDRVNLTIKGKKIEALLSKNIPHKSFCLPIEKVYNENNRLVGFTMNLANGDLMQSCVFSRKGLLKKFPHWNRINLANLAIRLLEQIEILHKNNILVGDINPYNIMVNSDNEIYFIDTDSFQVDSLPCTVETALFTAPELQGADFKKTLRTIQNEYFSIATLLFMIFLPGKNPWEYIGGSDLATNIKEQNFSYPLGEDDNLQAPRGIWEFIWIDLNYDLRKAFYNVFKDIKRFNLSQWITVIESYKQDLLIGECSKEIFPSQVESKTEKYNSLNINKGTSPEFKKNLRIEKTELSLDIRNSKIGVLELSTTAVKLLLADQEKIKYGNFDFNHFSRLSDRTDTGSLLDSDNIMDLQGFRETVIPAIQNRVDFAKKNNVRILYAVATAAYRSAYNRNQIIETIRFNCGVNVKILTKKEEALATLSAFAFSRPESVAFEKDKNYMFIDQGGGSTEITVFKGQNIRETYSVNLGSTVLKNIFFKEATETTTFDKAFKDSEKLIKDRLRVYLRNYNPTNLGSFCISVGNSIIQATGGKTAFTKHGVRLKVSDIKNKIEEFDRILRSKYTSISHLHDASEENKLQQLRMERKSDQVNNILNSRLSLPMYLEIMERFKLDEVVVSNTGLFYGVFLEKFLITK
jgi:serine/threonine protein kinase